MIRWNKFVQNALWIYTQRSNCTYCLGCSGEVAGRDSRVEANWRYYFNQPDYHDKIAATIPGYSDTMSEDQAWGAWLTVYRGKLCFDCSGLLDWCLDYKGVHKYSSWDFGGMPKNASIKAGPAGSVLWRKGHVGLDIGYGYNIEICNFGKTIELNQTATRDFTDSIKCKDVDYTGATAD